MFEEARTYIFYAAVVVLTSGLILLKHSYRASLSKKIDQELPRELIGAKLFYNEQPISIEFPLELSGRPDQVWQRSDNMLVIADTKNRKTFRYTNSDRIQLTGYAFILKHHVASKSYRIAPYGFIRIPSKTRARFLKVPLLREEEYIALYSRRTALIGGTCSPSASTSPIICHNCGHKKQCPKTLVKPT